MLTKLLDGLKEMLWAGPPYHHDIAGSKETATSATARKLGIRKTVLLVSALSISTGLLMSLVLHQENA